MWAYFRITNHPLVLKWLGALQEPSSGSSPEPDRSSPYLHPTSRRSIILLFSHLLLALPSGLLPSGFPIKTLYAPFLSPYVLHALLYFNTQIIFSEKYRALSSLLCSLLHSPVTSSLSTPLSTHPQLTWIDV
jgi:hypothetical protein